MMVRLPPEIVRTILRHHFSDGRDDGDISEECHARVATCLMVCILWRVEAIAWMRENGTYDTWLSLLNMLLDMGQTRLFAWMAVSCEEATEVTRRRGWTSAFLIVAGGDIDEISGRDLG